MYEASLLSIDDTIQSADFTNSKIGGTTDWKMNVITTLDESTVRQILKIGLDGRDQVDKLIESDDPEVRKFCRRIKMERRRRENVAGSKLPSKDPTALEVQLQNSTSKIKELLEDSLRSIVNVRVAALRSEEERQEREKRRREDIDTLIKEEAASAEYKFDEINSKWAVVNRKKDPLDIHEETEKQRDDCVALLEQKDALIDNLKSRLKRADKEFYSELIKQNDYMNILSDRINEQINLMGECYRMELQNLQRVIGQEKDEALNEKVSQWKEMAEAKETLEVQNITKRYNFIQQYEKQLDSLLIEQHELMRSQKIKMEARLNKLILEESQFESAVVINSELVNYNVQILQRREEEHRVLKTQQKRVANKWQETVRQLRQQKSDEFVRLSVEKTRATEELDRVTRDVRNAKERLRNLDAFSCQKYSQLWEFNQAIGEELANKLMQEDRYLHKELLFVPWNPPKNHLSKRQRLSKLRGRQLISTEREKLQKKPHWSNVQDGEVPKLSRLVVSSLLRAGEFLMNDKINKFLEPHGKQETALITVHHICEALGLTSKEDVKCLLAAFRPFVRCKYCQGSTAFLERDETKDEKVELHGIEEVSLKLSRQFETLTHLKAEGFQSEQVSAKHIGVVFGTEEDSRDEKPLGSSVSTAICTVPGHRLSINFNDVTKVMRQCAEKLVHIERRDTSSEEPGNASMYQRFSMKEVEQYWEEYPTMFDAKKRALWKSLLSNIKDYYKIILRKTQLTQDLKRMERQNMELRQLLIRYVPREPKRMGCSGP